MFKAITAVAAVLLLAFLAAGCGDGDEEAPGAEAQQANGTVDPAEFSATVDNSFFPLAPGAAFVHEGEETDPDTGDTVTVRVESTVLDETETIAGVEVIVVKVDEYEDGEIVESTLDYYAQHSDGTVYYFGESVDDYEDGEVVGHSGEWLAGEDGALPGEFMPADPQVGAEFEQEKAPGVAEDESKVVAVDEAVSVPAGDLDGCIKTEDDDPIGGTREFKWYCPDVGLVAEESAEGDRLELVRYQLHARFIWDSSGGCSLRNRKRTGGSHVR